MIDVSKFKDLFIGEAEDHLQMLNDNLLLLEKSPGDKDILNELMRSAHTLKSSSATMGFSSMAFLMHVMEDVFDYARNDKLEINVDIVNELFSTFDAINASLEAIKETGVENDVKQRVDTIKQITNVKTEGTGKSIRNEDGTPVVNTSTASNKNEVATNTKSQSELEKNTLKKPSLKSTNEVDTVVEEIEYIKVPVQRLDLLMDLVEELLIDKMRLQEMSGGNAELKAVVNHLERLVSDIQYQIMQARLVPVDQIFARFPRMIRDLSISQNKKIDLKISGGDIELDRTIIDKLGNPLVHLLRNAVDHGIGKEGVIKLDVIRDRDFALVSVENDGKGINYETVRMVAVKRGVVSSAEAPSLSKEQLISILFNPEFSTSETVTELSGRGVGLSVVKEFVEDIGGQVIVESPPKGFVAKEGQSPEDCGTRFILELPLTVAIVNSLLVKVRDLLFAIPFSNIVRSVEVRKSDVKSMADHDVAIIGGEYVPLIYLDKIFGMDEQVHNDDLLVVLIQKGTELAGIVVDGLKDEQEIIVKPLPESLKGVKGFSGSTILGNGRTIMILDIPGLLENSGKFVRVK